MISLEVRINNNQDLFAEVEPVLLSWLHVVREYTQRVPIDVKKPEDKDYSWWHNERPQVGFFSIAAWLNGWAVLQEWGINKKNSHGRNDLWIGRGKTQLYIEAKQGWCRIDEGEKRMLQGLDNHFQNA